MNQDYIKFTEELVDYPDLTERFMEIFSIVKNTSGDLDLADAAEQRVIDVLRTLGNDALHAWANSQITKKSDQIGSKPGIIKHSKKKSTG